MHCFNSDVHCKNCYFLSNYFACYTGCHFFYSFVFDLITWILQRVTHLECHLPMALSCHVYLAGNAGILDHLQDILASILCCSCTLLVLNLDIFHKTYDFIHHKSFSILYNL